ncbi:MYPU_1760 family metalloprotease [Mycoplasmopsis alligatoris]|uniref:Uncharacterized protein n=1 Tax=Mycoplasmopsis alligatoris A21JP2 TaxID=747682 RepID=D4XVN5_9BACT|nr:hypothetical protein [Mycoplasmopsis alligatoris]EFF41693.1 hypothetical protein MALL_0541 [Mycoplasmopsis alligatoris A21JP2]
MKKGTAWFIVGMLTLGIAIAGVAAGATYYIYPKLNQPSDSNSNPIIKTQTDVDDVVVHETNIDGEKINISSLEKISYPKPLNNSMTNEEYAKHIKDFNVYFDQSKWVIKEYEDKEGNSSNVFFREFIDPINGVKFRDYAYHYDPETKEKRFFLGNNGLIALAIEFRKKVTFGPEVYLIKTINVNDFRIITSDSKGIYIPINRSIYINTTWGIEKGLDIFSKIQLIIPTLFHEYMHHWASTYAEVADNKSEKVFNIFTKKVQTPTITLGPNDEAKLNKDTVLAKSPYTTPIVYYGNNSQHSVGYWNSYFVDNMYNLLNYDSRVVFNTIPNAIKYVDYRKYPDYAFNYLSLNDIYVYANSDKKNSLDGHYDRISEKFNSLKNVVFTSYNAFGDKNKGYTPNQIKYYYSMTELVPREWSKFTLQSGFNNQQPVSFKKAENSNNRWALSWSGLYINTGNQLLFYPSSVADDWTKVYLMDISVVSKDHVGPYTAYHNSVVFPNATSSLELSAWQNIWRSNENIYKVKNRDIAFYDNFLTTMGYGKTISQIMYENNTKWIDFKKGLIDTSESTFQKIRLMGYLPSNTKYEGFVFENKDQTKQLAKFKISPFNDFFKGDKASLEKVLTNGMAFRSYITEQYVDFELVDKTKGIKYWDDKNNNGTYDNGEDVEGEITLPESRYVTTLASYNNKNRDATAFKWYSIGKNQNGEVRIFSKEMPK